MTHDFDGHILPVLQSQPTDLNGAFTVADPAHSEIIEQGAFSVRAARIVE